MQRINNRTVLIGSSILFFTLVVFALLRDSTQLITLREFETIGKSEKIEKAVLESDYLYFNTQGGSYKIATALLDKALLYKLPLSVRDNSFRNNTLLYLALLTLFGVVMYRFYLSQKELIDERVSRSNKMKKEHDDLSRSIASVKSSVRFKDVGGIEEVKEELEEIIDFLKNPRRYRDFGIRMPKGVLLIGPPGVGKTMIAKAVAGEANTPFYYQSGASFAQIYVGMGAKRVKELFLEAKRNAPSIIFIDEIDAVGKARGGNRNDEREATLNQLLTEMDGFEESSGVIVIAATNQFEMLDSALLRAGRFDRRIFVDLPKVQEREAILKKYLSAVPHKVDADKIAHMTMGFNGASLATLVNEAAIETLRSGEKIVLIKHFNSVKDRVLIGKRRAVSFSAKERDALALYYAAKALSSYHLNAPYDKFSLMGSSIKSSSSELLSKEQILSHVKVLLSGIAVSHIYFNDHFNNIEADLSEAKLIVLDMIESYGMGTNLISSQSDLQNIITLALEEITLLLEEMRETIDKIKTHLLEHESISKEEVKQFVDEVL